MKDRIGSCRPLFIRRKYSGRTKGPAKRTKENDAKFEAAFESLLAEATVSD